MVSAKDTLVDTLPTFDEVLGVPLMTKMAEQCFFEVPLILSGSN